MKIGFIGLGNMGKPMATQLIKAGFDTIVYDMRKDPMLELVKIGACMSTSSKELVENSDVIITSLPLSPASPVLENVIWAEDGILAGLSPGKILIDCGNTAPHITLKICNAIAEKKCIMLDAAVSGGVYAAREGRLMVMVGGPVNEVNAVMPILNTIGKKVIYMGTCGNGQKTKLINNMIVYGTCALVAESLIVGLAAGIKPAELIEATNGGAAHCWALEECFPPVLQRKFGSGTGPRMIVGQLDDILELANTKNIPVPITNIVKEIYKMADCLQLGTMEDESGIIRLWEEFTGYEFSGESIEEESHEK